MVRQADITHTFEEKGVRFGQFKGLTDEEATLELAAWARRQRITVKFEKRGVRHVDVLFVLLRVRGEQVK